MTKISRWTKNPIFFFKTIEENMYS